MYTEAVYTSPPCGIIMLSVQIAPPVVGRLYFRCLLSACSWTTSPDHANAACRSPFARIPEESLPVNWRTCPESTAFLILSIARLKTSSVMFVGSSPLASTTSGSVSPMLSSRVTLPLSEESVRNWSTVRTGFVNFSFQAMPVDPLAARERASDLAEVLVVRVDVLEVIDLDAELLVERVERRPPLRLLVDVDVERPVREVECLRELVRAGCALLAGAAARSQQARNREDGATCGGPLEQLASGEDVGHSDPSMESTTNVHSGLQLSVRRVPGEAASRPGAAFCR